VGLAAGTPGPDSDIALFFISIPRDKPVLALVCASPAHIADQWSENFMNPSTKKRLVAAQKPFQRQGFTVTKPRMTPA
jgi:hypothetical protein